MASRTFLLVLFPALCLVSQGPLPPGSHRSSILSENPLTGVGRSPNPGWRPACPATREPLHSCHVHNHGGRSPAKLPDVRSARVDDMRHFAASLPTQHSS